MKKLVLVAASSIHTQRYLKAIATHCDQVVFITNHVDRTKLPRNVQAHQINFSLHNLKARFQIAKIIRTEWVPDRVRDDNVMDNNTVTIHIHQANSYAYHTLKAVALTKLKCKTILTTWGSDILLLPKRNALLKSMVKFNLSHADIITSDSLYMSSKIRELCPQAKHLHTINFGVHNFPDTLDLSKKEALILSSRLHKKLYNIDKIIAAFAALIKNPKFAHYKLAITANGTETAQLQQHVKTLGIEKNVIFYGMLNAAELAELYTKARIFVSIPSSDATSLSLLEAMAYGCYPVVSNLPANLEWVLDGINGTVCQSLNDLSPYLQDVIESITDNQAYTKLAEFNYAMIHQKAVFTNNLQKFLALYN